MQNILSVKHTHIKEREKVYNPIGGRKKSASWRATTCNAFLTFSTCPAYSVHPPSLPLPIFPYYLPFPSSLPFFPLFALLFSRCFPYLVRSCFLFLSFFLLTTFPFILASSFALHLPSCSCSVILSFSSSSFFFTFSLFLFFSPFITPQQTRKIGSQKFHKFPLMLLSFISRWGTAVTQLWSG